HAEHDERPGEHRLTPEQEQHLTGGIDLRRFVWPNGDAMPLAVRCAGQDAVMPHRGDDVPGFSIYNQVERAGDGNRAAVARLRLEGAPRLAAAQVYLTHPCFATVRRALDAHARLGAVDDLRAAGHADLPRFAVPVAAGWLELTGLERFPPQATVTAGVAAELRPRRTRDKQPRLGLLDALDAVIGGRGVGKGGKRGQREHRHAVAGQG